MLASIFESEIEREYMNEWLGQHQCLPLELTMPSNGAENDRWTSMWSLPHITEENRIV